MPDEDQLSLRQADQARTYFAIIETKLDDLRGEPICCSEVMPEP
jgi:hypothetical protein